MGMRRMREGWDWTHKIGGGGREGEREGGEVKEGIGEQIYET